MADLRKSQDISKQELLISRHLTARRCFNPNNERINYEPATTKGELQKIGVYCACHIPRRREWSASHAGTGEETGNYGGRKLDNL